MSTACVVRIGFDLPGDAREHLLALRRDFSAPVRWVAPTELRGTLVVLRAPGVESLDALLLVLRRLAARRPTFTATLGALESAPHAGGHRLRVALGEDEGALDRLADALREALTAYGFEVAAEAPGVLLGRCAEAPPALSPPRIRPLVPVEAFHWQCLDAATGELLRDGTVEFDRTPPASQAATEDRERSALEAELQRRLSRRPRPAVPRTTLPKPTVRAPASLRVQDPDTDGDDATEGDDDESDDTTE